MKSVLQTRHFPSLIFLLVLAWSATAADPTAWNKSILTVPLFASSARTHSKVATTLRGGGLIPAGYNPFGYKITELGEQFLSLEGSMDSDIGRFLSSLKKRKTLASLRQNWLEVVKVAKTAQAMRITRKLDEYIAFCLAANLIN